MKKSLFILLSGLLLISCSNLPRIPQQVEKTLKLAGKNRTELEKVIKHYADSGDSLKLKAAFFLIGNMQQQNYSHFIIADSNRKDTHFNVLDYPDYKRMVSAWDSIEALRGEIGNWRDKTVYDYDVITSGYLIANIDLAFKAWREFPWAGHINFDQFCEYILPYRGSNEPIEEWRPFFYEKYAWVQDSVKDKTDPVAVAALINNDIKSWFKFDSRFYRRSTDQGLSEMLKNKSGRCEDMTNLAIYAMRAMGVPVMSDFTPYWAKTGNNHAWNALIDKNGNVVIFMGGLNNPGEYQLNQAKAKVYRKTFARQPQSLAAVKPSWEKVPPYINRDNIIDVTRDYCPVSDVKLILEKEKPDSVNYAYLCVFNSGEWKALAWSPVDSGNRVNFKDMGRDIVYLPAYYRFKKIIPAGVPFILSAEGNIIPLNPRTDKSHSVKLVSTTRKITKNATDNIERAYFKKGLKYRLYYWNVGWKIIGGKKASGKALIFANVPENALLWLTAENSRKQERIFTIDKNGKQVWW